MGLVEALNNYEDYLRISTKSSINTISKYRNIVRLLLMDLKLDLSLREINQWIAEKNRKKSTYAYKYAIKHFLVSIGKHYWADQIVKAKKKPRKKVFKFVSKKKMQKIIDMLKPFHQRLAFMQIKTGARFGEMITIRAENIDFEVHEKLIYIHVGVGKSKTKGSKEGSLRVSKKYEPMIRSWMKRPYGYLFIDEKYENATEEDLLRHTENLRKYFSNDLAKKGEYYGVEGLCTHYLRHLFSDYFMISSNHNIFALQKVFRHHDIKTTNSYVSLQDRMVDNLLVEMEES